MNDSQDSRCPRCGGDMPAPTPDGLCPRCAAGFLRADPTEFTGGGPEAHPPLPPEHIAPHFPQLEILECLGRGGMGVVYRARQKTLNRLVALKLLAPERVSDAAFAERFAREAQSLAALNHPNIVTVYDFGQAGGFFYLLMEFVDGVNLRQLLCARKFTPEEALAIVPPLCDALQFAHERAIVHRDIKPENLLLDKSGRVKIADFGIARMLGATAGGSLNEPRSEGATQGEIGTRGYSAPEQQTSPQRVDSRADIYSLGVVFYEMLTGELPGKPIQPPSRRIQIDVRLDDIVLRALEKTPELRWQTAAEFRTQVERIASDPSRVRGEQASACAKPLPAGDQRLSRAAIIGALWSAVLFINAWMWFGYTKPIVPALVHQMAGGRDVSAFDTVVSQWGRPIDLLILFVGLLAPFGTTILGWVGVSHIRRSAGRLYGLGLAVFDGLLFPLLALDLVLLVLATNFNPDSPRSDAAHNSLVIVAMIGVGLLDFWIIRRAWRAVASACSADSSPSPGPGSGPTAMSSETAPAIQALGWGALCSAILSGLLGGLAFTLWPSPPALLVWSILAAALGGILLGIPASTTQHGKSAIIIGSINTAIWLAAGIVALFFLRPKAGPIDQASPPPPGTIATAGATATVGAFGPVTEHDIPETAMKRGVGLILEAGELTALAGLDLGAVESRFRSMGADVYYDPGKREWRALDMFAISWNEPSLDISMEDLGRIRWQPFRGSTRIDGFPGCYFQTRKGRLGILQIIPQPELPGGVKIRYKLAQNAPQAGARAIR